MPQNPHRRRRPRDAPLLAGLLKAANFQSPRLKMARTPQTFENAILRLDVARHLDAAHDGAGIAGAAA
jgi:hypothetical protein